jgi:hypothetical protein
MRCCCRKIVEFLSSFSLVISFFFQSFLLSKGSSRSSAFVVVARSLILWLDFREKVFFSKVHLGLLGSFYGHFERRWIYDQIKIICELVAEIY